MTRQAGRSKMADAGRPAEFAVDGINLSEIQPPRRLRAVRMNTADPIGIRSSGKS